MRLTTFPFLVLALSLVPPTRAEGEAPPSAPLPHPRLLANEDDFARIRSSLAHPGPLRDAWELVREAAGREYDEPPLRREVVGRRLLATSRAALRRILNFSLIYRLGRDPKWAARAEREMLALAAFPDWNPSHFLDTAEAAAAVAIGYDWLHDTLSPDSRRTLREALVRHALQPGDDDRLWWRNRATPNNWLQVCEAGLALAALAVAEDEPELAARAVERARRNVPAIFSTYEPSGSYVEGPMYWDYGTAYHVLLVEALRTATRDAGGLAANPAFLQSASVVNVLTGPSGDFFNFGDCSLRRGFMPLMYWFARENRRPDIAAFEPPALARAAATLAARSGDAALPTRFLALSLLWMPAAPPPVRAASPPAWATHGANPIAIFRRGAGRDSLYAGIKGGRARLSHGHMDAGSFILELGGVRWTTDPGMPNYHDLERQGVRLFGEDRWDVFVLGPHSHSIPLIDDLPPDEQATATLLALDENRQSATIDLTPLYRRQLEKLHRTLTVESSTSIRIRDEIEGLAPGARYRFSWMTRASVAPDAAGATLRQNGKTLRLAVTADIPFEIADEDASQPPAAYDAPQPGLRRVSVLFKAAQTTHTLEIRANLLQPQ